MAVDIRVEMRCLQVISLMLPVVLVVLWQPQPVSAGELWPKPQNQTLSDRVFCLDTRRFRFKFTGFKSGLLRRALDRYDDIIFESPEYTLPGSGALHRLRRMEGCVKVLEVDVGSKDQSLNDEVDETYVLRVEAPRSYITAHTVFGALRALETFSQLVDRMDHPPRRHRHRGMGNDGLSGDAVGDDAADDWLYQGGSLLSQLWAQGGDNGGDDDNDEGDNGGEPACTPDDCVEGEDCCVIPAFLPDPDALRQRHRRHLRRTLFLIDATAVWDGPRFRHRGLLLDTARHFLPVDTIMDHIDAMTYSKLNVLHWHIVDDQSFPYQSDALPELSEAGAYSWRHVYTGRDIHDVLRYAKDRGVRVIPEFDTPGHTASWGRSFPKMLTKCYDKHGEPTGELGPIDPTNEEVYGLMWSLLREVAQRFPDRYVHLGGDEVPFDCWKSNQQVLDWMASHNMTLFKELEAHYITRVTRLLEAAQKSFVVWQEVADNGVPLRDDAIVHVWKWWDDDTLTQQQQQQQKSNDSTGAEVAAAAAATTHGTEAAAAAQQRRRLSAWGPFAYLTWKGSSDEVTSGEEEQGQEQQRQKGEGHPEGQEQRQPPCQLSVTCPLRDAPPANSDDAWRRELARVTGKGHRAILSSPWYLDWGVYRGEDDISKYYSADPHSFGGDHEQHALVVGGEAAMWGEYVDATNSVPRTWPRAAVVAERLWSSADTNDLSEARPRLQQHRCRLLSRGIPAQPLGPGFCPGDERL